MSEKTATITAMTAPAGVQRPDVKAILDQLLGRAISLGLAQAAINALGYPPPGLQSPLSLFVSGSYSYQDCFTAYGV